MATGQRNKYCSLSTLKNESDVEQFFVLPLLYDLGYDSDYLKTKASIETVTIDKGKKRRSYSPDYLGFANSKKTKPILIVDAKHPNQPASEGVLDAQLYASVVRRQMKIPKPEQYCMGINGHNVIVKHYDSDTVIFNLSFADFVDENERWQAFKKEMSRGNIANSSSVIREFEFCKPNITEVRSIFEACHDVIWKREFESPVPAFWEFCKLMFVKLHADRLLHENPKLRDLLDGGLPIPVNETIFSTWYLDHSTNTSNPNPIATVFETIRDDLEAKVLSGEKKRIFERNERLEIQPLTIRRVVGLLEHHDLLQIDEDLNGRLFQTFLSATMRGKELGQYFTPRTVVEFMCELAELKVTRTPPYGPLVLDACCGTGGFLIEAMSRMTAQLKDGPLAQLTSKEKEAIDRAIKDDRLFGIDAGKDPPVARIARINMYLHGDGGSRIYMADALDKKVKVLPTATPDLRRELNQLKSLITGNNCLKFDVVLTNPPFSMKKESKEEDQSEILQQYESGYVKSKKHGSKKLRSSLKSNVMFLERYKDLLKDGGKLITVIDESVLNTTTAADHREQLFLNFNIRAIFSLPQDAFWESGANVKTSILVLDRKPEISQDQPMTFFGRSANIGYKGSKPNENLSDLSGVLDAYFRFVETGKIVKSSKGHWTDRTRFFAMRLSNPRERLDVEWHDPRHVEMDRRLQKIAKDKGYQISKLGGPNGLCEFVNGKSGREYVTDGIPIIKVRNITNEGINWDCDCVLSAFFDNYPKSHLKPGDVLVTTTGLGTIGRVDVVDKDIQCMTDSHVSGLRIRDRTLISSDYLVHYIRSPLGQMQLSKSTVGCTGQTELNDPDLKELRIIFPKSQREQSAVLKETKKYEEDARIAREQYIENKRLALVEFERLLGL